MRSLAAKSLLPPNWKGSKGQRPFTSAAVRWSRGTTRARSSISIPSRPPNPGDFVFLTVREPSFPAGVGYIRQFAGADLVSIRTYTINPKREELIPRQAVIEIATIVGSGLF